MGFPPLSYYLLTISFIGYTHVSDHCNCKTCHPYSVVLVAALMTQLTIFDFAGGQYTAAKYRFLSMLVIAMQ